MNTCMSLVIAILGIASESWIKSGIKVLGWTTLRDYSSIHPQTFKWHIRTMSAAASEWPEIDLFSEEELLPLEIMDNDVFSVLEDVEAPADSAKGRYQSTESTTILPNVCAESASTTNTAEDILLSRCVSAIDSRQHAISRHEIVSRRSCSLDDSQSFVASGSRDILARSIKDSIRARIQLRRINTGQDELKVDLSPKEHEIETSIEAARYRHEVRIRNRIHARVSRERFQKHTEDLKQRGNELEENNKSLKKSIEDLQEIRKKLQRIKKSLSSHNSKHHVKVNSIDEDQAKNTVKYDNSAANNRVSFSLKRDLWFSEGAPSLDSGCTSVTQSPFSVTQSPWSMPQSPFSVPHSPSSLPRFPSPASPLFSSSSGEVSPGRATIDFLELNSFDDMARIFTF